MADNRGRTQAPSVDRNHPVTTEGDSGDLLVAGVRVTRLAPEIRSAIVAEQLGRVDSRDSARRLITLLVLLVLSATAALLARHPAVWVVYWLVASQVVAGAFAAEHEALHGSMFHSIRANHAVGIVVGIVCACPYPAYRAYHLRHHARTRVPGDSEPAIVLRNRFEYLLIVPNLITGLAGLLTVQMLGTMVGRGPSWAPLRRSPALYAVTLAAHVAAGGLLVVAAILWGVGTVLAVWAVPLVLGLVVAGFLAAPEHYECAYGPAPVQVTTRSTISNRLTRFFMWNANYHAAHHLVPSVPGRGLGSLHEHLAGQLDIVEPSYVRYHLGLWRRIGRGQVPQPAPWLSDAR